MARPSSDSTSPQITVVAHEIRETGGMERAQARIVERLLERGWQVTVVARVCELAAQPGLTWRRVPTPRSPFVVAFPLFAVVASLMLARRRGDVVTTLGAIVLSRVDVATLQFCHHGLRQLGPVDHRGRAGPAGRLNQWLAGRLARAMERWCYRPGRVARLVAVSPAVAAELADAFPAQSERVTVIPNGVDLRRFRPDSGARAATRKRLGLAADARVAVFVGGDWERKGVAVAVRAVAARPDWRLLVVGPGDPGPLRRIAGDADERVTFAGPQPDTAPFYAAADAFVLPTQYEGFALVTLEAAASGLPLLATDAAGAAGLLLDGVTGWVLERDPQAFAAGLARLDDATVAQRMGQAAREAAARFSWADIGDAHAKLYGEIHRDRATAS